MSRTVALAPAEILPVPVGELHPMQRNPGLDPRIADAFEYIRANCQGAVTEEQLALLSGLSRSRFAHLFRQQTGETFRAALRQFRLAKAALLLADAALRVKEIAASCGYADSHSFDKAFRHRFGLTPAAYRHSTHGYHLAHRDTNSKLTA